MGKSQPTHQVECMCPICRRERGEIKRTKKTFAATINLGLLANFREFVREHKTPLSKALEEGMMLYMEKVEMIKQRAIIDKIISNPIEDSIQVYSDAEIQEWLQPDEIEPKVKAKIERILKNG